MINVANSIADIIYRLGFIDSTDLDNLQTWCNSTELYQWADEAAQLIAYKSGVFMTLDTSITAAGGTAIYSLPASHVFTLAAWFGATSLRITPVRELFAMDATWSTTAGAPSRCSFEAGSVGTITLYPVPTAPAVVSQLCEETAPTVALLTPNVQMPSVFGDYLSYKMLAGARGKESDGCQPEMAEHYEERCALYEAIIEHLYGTGQ